MSFLWVSSLPRNHWHKLGWEEAKLNSIWSSRIRTMRTLRTAIITADCDSTLVDVDVQFAFRARGDFAPGRRRRREGPDLHFSAVPVYVIKGRGPCSNSTPVPPSSPARKAWLRSDLSALSLRPGFSRQWGKQSWLDLRLEMRLDSPWHEHMAPVMVQTTPLFAPVPPSPPSSDSASVRPLGPTDGCSLALCL